MLFSTFRLPSVLLIPKIVADCLLAFSGYYANYNYSLLGSAVEEFRSFSVVRIFLMDPDSHSLAPNLARWIFVWSICMLSQKIISLLTIVFLFLRIHIRSQLRGL